VICRDGKIEAVGRAGDLLGAVPQAALADYSGCLIAPGDPTDDWHDRVRRAGQGFT